MNSRCALSAGILLFVLSDSETIQNIYGGPPSDLNAYLDKPVISYPDWLKGYNDEFLILKNGSKFPLSDHRTDKSFDELLEHPDIDNMFYVPYPAGAEPQQPSKNFDPGRVRFEPLFVAMYGDCKKNEVFPRLRTIDWLSAHGGGRVAVTTANGVDKALESVSRQLDQLPIGFVKYLVPTAGTYNCRTVAGSRVRSMHAYGAAIDLNPRYSDYWRWFSSLTNPVWKNRIPTEIVRIFEKQGFIWGGRWFHFDTMHFEYRPELL
jgi:D-alanyl-D-alanine carboxypeptidase